MRVIGFDGKKIKIKLPEKPGKPTQWFEGLLGIGITVADYNKFSTTQDKVIQSLFDEHGLKRNKHLYKGADLVSIFYGKGVDLIPILVSELIKHISYVDIYFLHIPKFFNNDLKTPNKIGVYYSEEIEYLSNIQFIELIRHHFPALCCYSYLYSLRSEIKGTRYCIDDCPILMQSPATVGVLKHSNTYFYYRGDLINPVINIADIFCRYVEEIVTDKKFKFDVDNNKNIIKALNIPSSKIKFHYINEKWLKAIKPMRKAPLKMNHKYPHPTYYIFNSVVSGFKDSRELIENSPMYMSALRYASLEGGCVKFFEPSDQECITKDDFLITHNEDTDKKTKELVGMGCPAKIIDVNFFKSK